MNQRICVDSVTALPDGNDAQVNRTTVAFQNGCSVMERMIAETTVMNCLKIARFATQKLTLNAPIIDAYQSKYSTFTLPYQ